MNTSSPNSVPNMLCGVVAGVILLCGVAFADTQDDFIFIHHSVGSNWLSNSLNAALIAKSYVDERNDITYGTVVSPSAGRPGSLGSVPGDRTDMQHWILWLNDYLNAVKTHGCATGVNAVIMFKSCYPNSSVTADGVEPGDPFSATRSIVNNKAVFRHPSGAGNTYSSGGYTYKPLEDVFAENPGTLFIFVTPPPLYYSATTDANAHRARVFNDWVKTEWLQSYNAAHPGLNNVVVFDAFNELANSDSSPVRPNRLKDEYVGTAGDSHPNAAGSARLTQVFCTDSGNVLDAAWGAFSPGLVTISGQVLDLSYTGIPSVTVSLGGGASASRITASDGAYSFAVSTGQNYTVTPSAANWLFVPSQYTFNNITSSQTGVNFSGTYTVTTSTSSPASPTGLTVR